jgi:hypothetical protein
MKIIKYILFSLVGLLASASFSACESPDKEFEHDNNLIAWMQLCLRPGAQGLPGVIEEYDANGNLVPANEVTVERVKGGYGVISFVLDLDYKGEYDPEHCYLNTGLTFDEVIKPGLAGIKNITNRNAEGVAQGIKMTVHSGIGTTREYTVIGYFDGEYQVAPKAPEN